MVTPLPTAFRRTFQSLTTRNYRVFLAGQTVSTVGTWMQRVAQDWLILELGGGPLELSIGIGLQSAPTLLLGMWGGVIADRGNLRKVMLWTQSAFALLSLVLGWLTVSGAVTIPLVYAFAFLVGCASVIDKPSRYSFVLEMVPSGEVVNAIALNSSVNNASRLIGPAVAGIVIALTGVGTAFFINAATFVAIIVAILSIDATTLVHRVPAARRRGQVIEGFRYTMGHDELRPVLLATLIVSTLAQNFRVLLPIFVVDVFGGTASSYGFLMSALGLGALIGALVCAYLSHPGRRMIASQALLFGVVLLIAAVAPSYLFLAVVMGAVGAGNTSFNTTSHSFALLRAGADKRGRVMALRELFSSGMSPFGSVLIGWICHISSPRYGFVVGGVGSLVAATLVWRSRGRRNPVEGETP